MISTLKEFFSGKSVAGGQRSKKIRTNTFFLFLIKGGGMVVNLLYVPILFNSLNKENYGIWLTITSIVSWVYYFDFGLGHGLRNRYAEARAREDDGEAGKLVSNAYFFISIILGSLFLILLPVIFFINWNSVLNTTLIENSELRLLVLIVLSSFTLKIVLEVVTIMIKADQKPAAAELYLFISSFLSLVAVCILVLLDAVNLLTAALAVVLSPVIILVIFNFRYFSSEYAGFRPNVKDIDRTYFSKIFSLGSKFFVIQVAMLVLFSSSNLLIIQMLNPSEVAVYNISLKYYQIPTIFFSIVVTPYWSAITEAYTRKELDWIKMSINKLLKLAFIVIGGVLFMAVVADPVYRIWINKDFEMDPMLNALMALYTAFTILGTVFTHFIMGVGKLKVGLLVVIVKMIVFIPFAVFLLQQVGSSGLVIALILVNSIPSLILESIQYRKIIQGSAKGIWQA